MSMVILLFSDSQHWEHNVLKYPFTIIIPLQHQGHESSKTSLKRPQYLISFFPFVIHDLTPLNIIHTLKNFYRYNFWFLEVVNETRMLNAYPISSYPSYDAILFSIKAPNNTHQIEWNLSIPKLVEEKFLTWSVTKALKLLSVGKKSSDNSQNIHKFNINI